MGAQAFQDRSFSIPVREVKLRQVQALRNGWLFRWKYVVHEGCFQIVQAATCTGDLG